MPTPTLHDVHIDAALSNVSVAYRNELYIAEQVFPNVPVQKKSDYYFEFGPQAWQRSDVQPRGPGSRARRGGYTITTGSYACITYALAIPIPDEVRDNADTPLRPDVDGTAWVTDQLLKGLEIRVAALTTGGSGLWTYSTTPTTAWTSDTSDPIGDIEAMKNGIIGKIGRLPNVMVMSYDVWMNLAQHPDILDRTKYTNSSGILTVEMARNIFGVQKLLVGTAIQDTALEGATPSTAYIWGDQTWMGYVTPRAALLEPSAGYTFSWKNREVRTYREDQEHQDVIEAQHSVDELICASLAGGVLYNCV